MSIFAINENDYHFQVLKYRVSRLKIFCLVFTYDLTIFVSRYLKGLSVNEKNYYIIIFKNKLKNIYHFELDLNFLKPK